LRDNSDQRAGIHSIDKYDPVPGICSLFTANPYLAGLKTGHYKTHYKTLERGTGFEPATITLEE
jgi:hypothetical protein